MTQWKPEQQITALKYGAYTVLACCLIFISGLVREILATIPYQTKARQCLTCWLHSALSPSLL